MEKGKEEEAYSPLACLPDGLRWDDVETLKEKMIEKDPYTDVAGVISKLRAFSTVSTGQLEGLTTVIATGKLPLTHMPPIPFLNLIRTLRIRTSRNLRDRECRCNFVASLARHVCKRSHGIFGSRA
jgi:hypothetical protein